MNLTLSGINSEQVLTTDQVENVISGFNKSNTYNFHARPFVKTDLNLRCDTIKVSELENFYPHLAPVPSLTYQYSDVEKILGQGFFHVFRPRQ